MKKIISTILVVVIISLSVITSTAVTDLGQMESKTENNITISTEDKILTTVNVNDNFVDDEIIVVLNNNESIKLKEYTSSDFSEVPVESVENLTKATDDMLKAQRQAESVAVRSVGGVSVADESVISYINEDKYHQFYLLKLSKSGKENVIKSIKLLEQREDVILAMPNYIREIGPMKESSATFDEMESLARVVPTMPNDYSTTNTGQWGIERIDLPEAWTVTTGSNTIVVGVMDSGIKGNHEDLSANIASSSYHGNFIGDGTNALTDQGGHGTQVAGVIAAVGNNGKGTVGACWNIKLASLKVFSYNSQTKKYSTSTDAFVNAITYAQSKGIPIINYSAGGGGYYESVLTALSGYNGLFVCAAGNDGVEITGNYYPASYDVDNMIVVAKGSNSTDDALASDASYSSTYVDLSAPGVNILTTDNDATNGYIVTEGSSISAPYVTGVAALLKSEYPGMDAAALKDYILSNVDVRTALNGRVATSGRLNAHKALTNLKKFTVMYDANGGGGATMSAKKYIYGCATPLSRNTFTRTGYTFKGWNAQRTDSGKWYYTNGTTKGWYLEGEQPSGYYKYTYRDQQKVGRLTTDGKTAKMYAVWEKKFNVEFVGNDATGGSVDNMAVVSGSVTYLPSDVFTRTGCTLDHWYVRNSDREHYFTDGTSKGWYASGSKPSGYTRIDYAKGSLITAEDIEGIEYDETVSMCAYWTPNSGMLGDANISGDVDVRDATYIQRYLAGLVSFTDDNQYILADVNFDGDVDVKDSTLIQLYAGGHIDEFGE